MISQQQHWQLIFFLLLLAITSWSISAVHSTTGTTWVGYDPRNRQRHYHITGITSAFIDKKQRRQEKNARRKSSTATKRSTNIITTPLSNEEWETGIIDNILLSKSIGDCIIQEEEGGGRTRRRNDPSSSCVTTNTNNKQYQKIKTTGGGGGRSDVLYNIRGGSSSYNGRDDDDNDYGYNGSYRDDGIGGGDRDDWYNKNNSNNAGYDDRGYSPSYYNNDSSSSSGSSRDRYYDDDYGSPTGGVRGSGYYDDEGRYHEDYDDRGGRGRRGSSSSSRSKTKLPTALTSSNRKLGTIFLASGATFTVLGITLFFNKTLMRLGNLLFVIGVPLMIGPGRTVGYFLQPKKARATGCLCVGIFLVLVGHPVFGILLEIFGLLNLFGNMFPLVMMMAKNLPVVGGLFNGSSGGSGKKSRNRGSRYDDDQYYEEDRYYERDEYRRDDNYDRY